MTLAGANSFTGPVAVNYGQLIVANSGVGNSSGVTVQSVAALTISGGAAISSHSARHQRDGSVERSRRCLE